MLDDIPFMEMHLSAQFWRRWITQLPMHTSTVSPFFTVFVEDGGIEVVLPQGKIGLDA
jgi:hypothetical protein